MSEGFPVFIGITGKREFSEDPQAARELEHKVRAKIAAVIDHFDEEQPEVTKILLTGAASGSDLIAAEAVLGIPDGSDTGKARRNWLVLAVLPFEPKLFREDFTDDEWKRFERVTADARTHTLVLPPLRDGAGHSATFTDLDRRPDNTEAQKEMRRRHYEQIGLWIVDTANILLAVLPASEHADKVGGTARIVACRRSGRPDPVAAEVIAASEVLAPRNPLLRPPSGYVWLIDPLGEPSCDKPPVTVLPPAPDTTSYRVVYEHPCGLGAEQDTDAQQPGHEEASSQAEHLHESQRVLRMAAAYQLHRKPDAKPEAQATPSLIAWPRGQDPASVMQDVWNTMSPATNRASEIYRRVVYTLIGAFLVTVLAWESFAEFTWKYPHMLGAYLLMLVVTLTGYVVAARRELQPVAEDRRAIHEALRVQAAWWHAGLVDRIDFVYLEGADHDLARVREAVRNVIAYALLICGTRDSPPRWDRVFNPQTWKPFDQRMPGRNFPRDWVGSQLYYFRQRKEQRRAKGEYYEALSWTLFATGVCLALTLLALTVAHHLGEQVAGLVHKVVTFPHGEELVAVLAVAGASFCWWLGSTLMPEAREKHERLPLTMVAALVAAMLLFTGIHVLAPFVAHITDPPWITLILFIAPGIFYAIYWWRTIFPDPNHVHRVASAFGIGAALLAALGLMALVTRLVVREQHEHDLIADFAHAASVFLVIYVPALAGALRFVSEKFAVEAEAITYREGHVWFEHAREMLAALKPGQGDADADRRAQDVIRRLGRLALEENETWLKTRRQRPLSPVVGG